MFVKGVSLRGFRSYRRLDLELGPGMNLFFGDNARGKTNLLEAVCYLGSLRSFRGAKTSELITWGETEGHVSARVVTGGGAGGGDKAVRPGPGAKLSVAVEAGRRRVAVDGKRPADAASYLRILKVASFSPEDLFLVREYPSHRRRFLDRSIFHLRPGYLELANEYRRALSQLNAALKVRDEKVVRVWEEVLAPLAAQVCVRRREQVELLKGGAAAIFGKVLGGDSLEVAYRTAATGDDVVAVGTWYRDRLSAKRPEAMKRGHAGVGPHTDDLVLTLSGREMRASASRGQGRLALLALVLADAELYREERGEYPVLLLDDVGSELDEKRRRALADYVSEMGQTLITATGRSIMDGVKGRCYRVETGVVAAE